MELKPYDNYKEPTLSQLEVVTIQCEPLKLSFIQEKLGGPVMSFADFFKKKTSGSVAKDRLKLVLISDRANCSPEIMEKIKNDIIQVISKYVEIDTEGLDIKITQTESDGNNGSVPALFANIPIKEVKSKN